MPTEEQMTVNERRKYLKLMKPLYQQAKRGERSRLLSAMQEVTGLHQLLMQSRQRTALQEPLKARGGVAVKSERLVVPGKSV